jgi:hypothetical protein
MMGPNGLGLGVWWQRAVSRATCWLIAASVSFVAACGEQPASESNLGRSRSAVVVDRVVSYSLPPMTPSQEVALAATRSLTVHDRAKVRTINGGYATIANLATGTTGVGVDAHVGNLWSVPNVALQERASVHGFLKTSGVVQPQNGTSVSGGTTEHLTIVPEQRTRHVLFPAATQNVDVEPNQQRQLAPGSYLRLNVKGLAKLTLSSGVYYFESLTFESQAEIRLNKTDGPIYVYVLNSFIQRGTFVDGGGKLANVFWGYFGTSDALVEAPFLGTLVAPSAKISLATVGEPGHRGAFFGKDIDLAADTTVVLHPFGVTVQQLWTAAASGNEAFLDLAVRSDGGALAATGQSVVSLQPNGSATQVFSGTANASTIFLNRSGTNFGVATGANVMLRRADGSTIRSFSRSSYEYSVLVPGSETAFSPELGGAHDAPRVVQARFVGGAGAELARFAATGLEVSRLTSTHLYYSTPTQLSKVTQGGTLVWRANAALASFEVSQGARLIAKLRDGRSAQHFVDGVAQPAVNLGQPIFRIAIAPAGVFSAVATQQALQVFQNGQAFSSVSLPVASVTSLAISDRGEVLLGAVLDGSGRRALLLDAQGEVLSDQILSPDSQAFRPGLSFRPGADSFFAREAARVTAFNINRSL